MKSERQTPYGITYMWNLNKNDRMISNRFQGKPFNIKVLQVYASTTKAEEAEVECFSEDLQELLEPTPKKDVLIIGV